MTRRKYKTKKEYYIRDYYFNKAKKEEFVARSVYKLKEIDEKYHLIKKGQVILDLGASPGSWIQYVYKVTEGRVKVVAVDMQPLKLKELEKRYPTLTFIKTDIFDLDIQRLKEISDSYDIVLSDMAPSTMGDKFVDHERSVRLFLKGLDLALNLLKNGGSFLGKLFQGEEFLLCRDKVKSNFKTVKVIKTKATRKESSEIFILGIEKV